jgi:6-phospho-3-hexuloisomerase
MKIPDSLTQILDELKALVASMDREQVERLADAILGAKRVFVAGRGRTGLAMQAFAMRLMHLGLDVAIAGETLTPGITSGDILVAGSGSGETRFTNLAADIARGLGASIACITSRPGSQLARHSNIVVVLPAPTFRGGAAGTQESAQPRGSLFEQGLWLLLDGVVLVLMSRLGISPEALLERHANVE